MIKEEREGLAGYVVVAKTADTRSPPAMTSYPDSAFASSHQHFDTLIGHLTGEKTEHLDAAAIEAFLDSEGRDLMRVLLQDHLNLRASREEATIQPMRAADGERRTETRPATRTLGTLFGEVDINRIRLVKRGTTGGLLPLDAHLNLPSGKYSFGVARRLAFEVAQASYTTAIENIRRTTSTTIARRQVEAVIGNLVVDFEDFYLHQDPAPVDDDELLVLSFDGSGVIMRPEGLREDTRKRAADRRRRSTAETAAATRNRSAHPHRKRMAEVATVYALKALPRTPEDLVKRLRSPGPHPVRPRAENKRVWASLSRSVPDVIDEAFVEAGMRDPANQRRWVVLLDGNEHQLASVEAMAANAGVEVTVIVDFIHVLGYLWKAGKALVGPEPAAIESWVARQSHRVLQGKARWVASGMRCSATVRGLEGSAREAVDTCAGYLLKYQSYLHYDAYLQDGLPIATGVIEGACRWLVKDRMDITGARWGLEGGEAVLQLRALRASGDLDDYIDFHARREQERNHLSKFDDGELVELRTAA